MNAILIGLICACFASIPGLIQERVELERPLFLLGLGVFGAFVQYFYFTKFRERTRAYDGMADLFIFIHSRLPEDGWLRWFYRSFSSLFLHVFGAGVGVEGAAAEASQSYVLSSRSRSELWNESRRRTDVSSILAGSIAAVFQAPFAAVVLSLEVGAGGRTLSAILSALSAYAGTLFISKRLDLELEWLPYFEGLELGDYSWPWIVAIGVLGGVVSFLLIRGLRWFQEGVVDLFRNAIWARSILGGGLLASVLALQPQVQGSPMVSLTSLVMSVRSIDAQASFFLAKVLMLAAVVGCFGTIGVFWPLFIIGASFGLMLLSGVVGIFVGAAALWAGVLGAPIAAGVLAFEMTHSWKLMVAALLTGFLADFVRRFFRQSPLIHRDLEARGLSLLDGRSASVLSSIQVRDAMVTDHETVVENDLVRDLTDKFLNSKHPFLPVVNRKGEYVGLLTLDMIQDGFSSARGSDAFFEVKDLLYKSKIKLKTVRETDALSQTSGSFGDHSCVAVVNAEARVVGLLFSYSIRAAYDREVARRSLADSREEPAETKAEKRAELKADKGSESEKGPKK
jgi:H+/Cl- antiporter ClcA